MGLLVSGLLGGIQAGARAVEQLSDDKLKALAEKLKMDALEQMDKRRELRGQKFKTSERKAGQTFRTSEREAGEKAGAAEGLLERQFEIGESGLDRDVKADRLAFDKDVNEKLEEYRGLSLKAKAKSTEAAVNRNKLKAWEQVAKIKERDFAVTPENVDEINGILEAGATNQKYVLAESTPETGGILGTGILAKEATSTYKLVSTTGKGIQPPATEAGTKTEVTTGPGTDTGQSDLDALLAMGRRGAGGSKLEGEVIPRPKPEGLLGKPVEVPKVPKRARRY